MWTLIKYNLLFLISKRLIKSSSFRKKIYNKSVKIIKIIIE